MPRHNHLQLRRPATAGSSRPSHAKPAGRRARIGQHFLSDPLIARDIADAADLAPVDEVLEIGPGGGALTEYLIERAAHVTAVELDEEFAARLRRRFAGESRLTVIAASALAHRPDELLAEAGREGPYKVVANLPYYITAPIFRHYLEHGPPPSMMVVTVQREVAESVAGRSGGLSLLGVSVQVFGSVQLLFRVPPRAFTPPPRVESAVIRVDVYERPVVPEAELQGFFQVVRSGFRAPRKQLHNGLGSGLWIPPDMAGPLLESAGIDPGRRPATLSIEDWYRLYSAYEAARPGFGDQPGRQPVAGAEDRFPP
ncbi:MAG: 16S rRNA (adenine(1518)-N(6)/adenine(1519)-N(6))-dimethyltransferase RsmA [Dehalococcoidia bacterium]